MKAGHEGGPATRGPELLAKEVWGHWKQKCVYRRPGAQCHFKAKMDNPLARGLPSALGIML